MSPSTGAEVSETLVKMGTYLVEEMLGLVTEPNANLDVVNVASCSVDRNLGRCPDIGHKRCDFRKAGKESEGCITSWPAHFSK